MIHWHVKVTDGRRETGALATTFDAGKQEQQIEYEINPTRNPQLKTCDRPCFGTRAG